MADKKDKSGGPASASLGERNYGSQVSKSTSKPVRLQPSVCRATGGDSLPFRGQRQRPPGYTNAVLDFGPPTRTKGRSKTPASGSARPNTVGSATGKETTPPRPVGRCGSQMTPAESVVRSRTTRPVSRSQAAAIPVTGSFNAPKTASGAPATSSRPGSSREALVVRADMVTKQAKTQSSSGSQSATDTAESLYCEEQLDDEPETVPPPDEEISSERSPYAISEDARRRASTCLPPGKSLEMKICIESDFLLAARNAHHEASTLHGFVSILAANHNRHNGHSFPSLSANIRHALDDNDYGGSAHGEWSIANRRYRPEEQSSRSFMLATPVFFVYSGSPWREAVRATWQYLQSDYDISVDHTCNAHFRVELEPQVDLREFKQIAGSIIYFEAAFEALVPPSHRRNERLLSHHRDGPVGAGSPRTSEGRLRSIAKINDARDAREIHALMQRDRNPQHCWHLQPTNSGTRATIAFHKPPGFVTANEALGWAELAISFLQAARRCGYLPMLNAHSANTGGLARFLTLGHMQGVSQPWLWRAIFAGTDPTAAIEA